jgi:hypothetical protein
VRSRRTGGRRASPAAGDRCAQPGQRVLWRLEYSVAKSVCLQADVRGRPKTSPSVPRTSFETSPNVLETSRPAVPQATSSARQSARVTLPFIRRNRPDNSGLTATAPSMPPDPSQPPVSAPGVCVRSNPLTCTQGLYPKVASTNKEALRTDRKFRLAGLPEAGETGLEPATPGFGDRCTTNCATPLRTAHCRSLGLAESESPRSADLRRPEIAAARL